MTLVANVKIRDISEGPTPITILASADVEDPEDDETSVTSNTEGEVLGIEISIKVNADTVPLQIGDHLSVNTHFG